MGDLVTHNHGKTGFETFSHARAIVPHQVENTGAEDLVLIKVFGPDINPQAPRIPRYPPGR